MEALFSEFTLLSDQALSDRSFDPSTIEGLMKLFEVEAYKEWAHLEAQSAEDDLDSAMESAMAEFRRFEEEMNQTLKAEHDSLVGLADAARTMGKTLEKAATFASNKYIDAAVNSAAASMRSAVRAVASAASKKVHPS